jgi:hypothetical protein
MKKLRDDRCDDRDHKIDALGDVLYALTATEINMVESTA